MKHRFHVFLVVILALLVNVGMGFYGYCKDIDGTNGQKGTLRNIDMMIQALQLIRRNYVDGDKISTEELLHGAIEGMTAKLDPFSTFLPPRDAEFLQDETEGKFGGVGISINQKNGVLTVISTIPGTPAYKAGILPEDQIIEVDGTSIEKGSLDEILYKLRGDVGSKVVIGVRRDKKRELLKFKMTRASIPIQSVVDLQMVPSTQIGYFRITQFMRPTAQEVQEALIKLLGENAQKIIIDLRGNPGGLLSSAVDVCSLFLPENMPVVSIEGRNSEMNNIEKSRISYKFPKNIPIILIINGGSASAAEIMSGCLNDYHRAVLLGEKSFGKGSVQNINELMDGCVLKLTIAKYYTPSRRVIHNKGIMPNIEVKMTREAYMKLLEADHDQIFALDPQIQEAIKIIRDPKAYANVFAKKDVPLIEKNSVNNKQEKTEKENKK
ncbi:MAG: S41 family peptidase [Lentisphaeria bacterium]